MTCEGPLRATPGVFPSLLVVFCFLSVGTKDVCGVGGVRRGCGDSSLQPQLQTPRTPELPHFEKKNEKNIQMFSFTVNEINRFNGECTISRSFTVHP